MFVVIVLIVMNTVGGGGERDDVERRRWRRGTETGHVVLVSFPYDPVHPTRRRIRQTSSWYLIIYHYYNSLEMSLLYRPFS